MSSHRIPEVAMSHINALQISSGKAGPALTPPQKRFNTLIRQIEQARHALTAWNEHIAAYRQAHAQVLLPLQGELIAGRRQWAFALDALLDQRHWTKSERSTLRELLCEAAGELLEARGEDAELKALFDKHAEVDFDTERREAVQAMKDLTEAMTGLDLGEDEGIETEADLFERMQQGLRGRAATEEAQRSERAARRRKTAAQQRRESEAEQATQSVREIYRKLASALHPDRETDQRQREAKTALMQRVNQAYGANNLLALLELQLQIEQIDASHIANASAQRLKHYNKVLSEQLSELRAEIEHVEMAFRMEFGLEPGWGMNPRKLGEVLEQTRRQWRAELSEQQRDMRMLGDVAATKRWLKRQRQLLREAEFDFAPF
jgi:hypothetical protein